MSLQTIRIRLGLLACALLMSGCATPLAVKQLSVNQLEYFDTAIQAVSVQSETLVMAAEKMIEQSKQRISAQEAANRERFNKLTEVLATIEGDKKLETVNRILNESEKTSQVAEAARNQLTADLEIIKAKSEELKAFLVKMKEVQQALDAYAQSEKAGERLLKDTFNQPSLQALFAVVDKMAPQLASGMKEMGIMVATKCKE